MERTNIARVFQISLYFLTVLVGVMAALAEGAFFPGIFTLPVALVAFFANELRGRLRLSTGVSRALVGGAFVIAGFEYLHGTMELRVLALLHLLVYLTWIVLFVHRPPRHYWWLCGLGLMQVAFGAVLTGSGWFGILLGLYLLAGMWTLALFTLYQGELRALTLAASPGSQRSGVRNSILFGRGGRWFTFRFAGNVVLLAVAGACLGGVLFMFVPRVWSGGARASIKDISDTASTGFSEEVRLGAMGEILENSERVMQVRLFDNDTNVPMDVIDYAASLGYEEPYFRGMILDAYTHGQWKASAPAGRWSKRLRRLVPRAMVRQEFRLEGLRTNVLFAIPPFTTGWMRVDSQFIETHPETAALSIIRLEGPIREYFIFSPRIKDGKPVNPSAQQLPSDDSGDNPHYLALPGDLARLSELAHEVVRGATTGAESNSAARKAQAILEYLRDSGEYGYTLKANVIDPRIDPVEDFLFNRREGHCEHFASALALMLRCVDVPARLVTGFKGGRFNELTNMFEVQQRHAHSWVEAFVDEKWVILDATPSGRQRAIEQSDNTPNFWKNLKSFSVAYWNNYVVRLDAATQQDLFFDPLQKKIGNGMQAFRSGRRGQSPVGRWFREFYTTPKVWLGWRGVLAVCVLAGLAWGMVKLIRRLPGWTHRIRSMLGNVSSRRQLRIDFYERFCRLAASRGLERRPEQTQREFIEETAAAWSDPPKGGRVLTVPKDLPELFYNERFGGAVVSEDDRAALQRDLDTLETQLQETKLRR